VKWYFAINEAGALGEVGWHARLAVLSALQRTSLDPVLLHTGAPGPLTAWMESRGVRVLNVHPPFERQIAELDARGRYSSAFLGHWLRSMICLLENTDQFVLYTDCDVVFISDPKLGDVRPACFASAPEFRRDNWNYVNTGVMVINVPALKADFQRFIAYALDMMGSKGSSYSDQIAYNEFYRGIWDRLDPRFNWKPYWGWVDDIAILHYHGPKLGAVRAIVEGRWSWNNDYGKQLGSLLVGHTEGYLHAVSATLDAIGASEPLVMQDLAILLGRLATFSPGAYRNKADLSFMDFNQFGTDR
jgi:hypothetical protein